VGTTKSPQPVADPSFGALAETMALGMAYQMLLTSDGAQRRFLYVSESCAALNGVSAAAALADAEALYGLIAPEDRVRMAKAEAEAIAKRTSFDIEVRFQRPDGELRWNRIASAPRTTPLPDGSIVWDGIQIDVTDKKRIELELAEQRRRLDLAVEATGLGFWEWDLRAESLAWSDRNRELFGFAEDEALDIGRFMEALHPDDREMVRTAYENARDQPDGADFSTEYRVVLPDGGIRWILVHARVVRDEAGPRLVVGTSLDVTGRREAEERRDLLTRELAHRAKNGLAVVEAIARQSARSVHSVEEYAEVFVARLHALAQSQDLVTEGSGRTLHLADLLRRVLEPFGLTRFTLDPALKTVDLNGETGFGAALLIHELATNAAKYGALATAKGHVEVTCESCGPGLAKVAWRETGGPATATPIRRGFGARLMDAALRPQGGKAEARFEPSGLTVLLDIPIAD
jgi:PAS domain S-box-containing protein